MNITKKTESKDRHLGHFKILVYSLDKEDVVHIYNGIFLSHKKEWSNAIYSKMDRPRDDHPFFWPGESQGWWSLVGCHLWGRTVAHDWSDLAAAAAEMILLSEVSQTKTNIMWYHFHLSCCGESKKKWYKWNYIQTKNRWTDRENKLVVTKRGKRGGINEEFGINRYTLLYIK